MTLGIVGFGALGKGVARMAKAFHMEVLVAARPGTDVVPGDRVPLGELLERCDVISLHCPLTAGKTVIPVKFQQTFRKAAVIEAIPGQEVINDSIVIFIFDSLINAAPISLNRLFQVFQEGKVPDALKEIIY